jgi:hypothetical protein
MCDSERKYLHKISNLKSSTRLQNGEALKNYRLETTNVQNSSDINHFIDAV